MTDLLKQWHDLDKILFVLFVQLNFSSFHLICFIYLFIFFSLYRFKVNKVE